MIVKHIGMTHVKATTLLDLPGATLTHRGIEGDRDFILLNESGKPLGPGQHRHFLPLRFALEESGRCLCMTLPEGSVIRDECFAIGPSFELDYLGMRTIAVRHLASEWNRRLSDFSKQQVEMVRVTRSGDGVDVFPLTILTTGSLRDLSQRLGSPVDFRRFRASLIIDCDEPYAEDHWAGKLLRVGSCLLRIGGSVPRCVVTQLDPDTGRNNAPTVAALLKYRSKVRLPNGLMPAYSSPGFASYAEVVRAGAVHVGDPVVVAEG